LISIKLIALTYSNHSIFLKIQEKEQRQQENREGGEGRAGLPSLSHSSLLYVVQEEQWQSPIYHHRSEFAGSPKSKHDLIKKKKKKTKRVQLFS
jgi:hypothetical protein